MGPKPWQVKVRARHGKVALISHGQGQQCPLGNSTNNNQPHHGALPAQVANIVQVHYKDFSKIINWLADLDKCSMLRGSVWQNSKIEGKFQSKKIVFHLFEILFGKHVQTIILATGTWVTTIQIGVRALGHTTHRGTRQVR